VKRACCRFNDIGVRALRESPMNVEKPSPKFLSSRYPFDPEKKFRSGFTLIEVLISLFVISVVIALAWPNILRLQSEQRLLDSAEKVRSLIAVARAGAIESGLAHQFRYELSGQHFLAIPFEREFESTVSASSPVPTDSALPSSPGRVSRRSGTTMDRVTFRLGPTSTESQLGSAASVTVAGQQLSAEVLEGLPDAGQLSNLSWSGPIIFQPDGSAADSEFALHDQQGHCILFHIRGITGAVSVGRIARDTKR